MCCSLNSFWKAFTCPVFYALLNYYFAAEVQLIIVSYWTGSRIFFNDALEHNEWCGRMLASLTSHVFARGQCCLILWSDRLDRWWLHALLQLCYTQRSIFSSPEFWWGSILEFVESLMMKLERSFPRVTFVENFGDWFFSISRNRYFQMLGILALRLLPRFVFPRKEWTSGSRRERSDDEQWLSTRVCRVIFNWFTYHASCMYRIG